MCTQSVEFHKRPDQMGTSLSNTFFDRVDYGRRTVDVHISDGRTGGDAHSKCSFVETSRTIGAYPVKYILGRGRLWNTSCPHGHFRTNNGDEICIQSVVVRKRPDQMGHSLSNTFFDRVDYRSKLNK